MKILRAIMRHAAVGQPPHSTRHYFSTIYFAMLNVCVCAFVLACTIATTQRIDALARIQMTYERKSCLYSISILQFAASFFLVSLSKIQIKLCSLQSCKFEIEVTEQMRNYIEKSGAKQ